jgi:hypothetical protein
MEDIQKIKEFFSKPMEEGNGININETKFNFIKSVSNTQLKKNAVYYAVSLRDGNIYKLIYEKENSDSWEFSSYPGGTGSVPHFFDELTQKNEWFSNSNNSIEPDTVLFANEKDAEEASMKIKKIQEFFSKPLEEAQEEDRYKRPIVTNKQGKKFILQGFLTSGYYLIPYDGSKYWTHFSVSKNKWIPEKSINWDDYNFTKQQFEKLKASHGESEKEINKKFQDMNEAKEEDVVDTITMDVPLFLRMLEYSKEDAAEDMDLHDVTEKAIALNKSKEYLSMEDYNEIVGAAKEIDEATSDYMKRRKAQDDYVVNKKDKPAKSYNPTPSGKTDYMKRREKELAEAVFAKLKK